jgi:hypothetical protein
MKLMDEERERLRERREKERKRRISREYYAKNKEKCNESVYRWRRNNRERWNAWQRAYYAAHKQEISERRKAARLERLAADGA